MKELKTTGRGRPKTPLIQRLRVIFWSHYVLGLSGSIQVNEFEQKLKPHSRKVRLSSGLWARYMRGEVLPQGTQHGKRSALPERLDAVYPGGAKVFHSPLWELLDFNTVLGPQELKAMYLRLDKSVWTKFVSHPKSANPEEVSASRYWTMRHDGKTLLENISKLPPFDALCVSLIEARMNYLRQEEAWFMACMFEARTVLHALTKHRDFLTFRMQVVLLTLEGLLVGHIREHLLAAPMFRESRRQVREYAMEFERRWAQESLSYCDQLPRSHQAVFKQWRSECAPRLPYA